MQRPIRELAPQELRRTQATLATDAGVTGLMIAQYLGHAVGEIVDAELDRGTAPTVAPSVSRA